MDHHHNHIHPVVARGFRWEDQSQFSEDRQLDTHINCDRPRSSHIEIAGGRLIQMVTTLTIGRGSNSHGWIGQDRQRAAPGGRIRKVERETI